MSWRSRLDHYKKLPGLDGIREFMRPKAWGPEKLSTLLGDSIKDVLLDRHARMEKMIPEQQENRRSREILQDRLEIYPSLKTQANRFFEHPEVLKHNPKTASQFINAIVSAPLVYARTAIEMQRQISRGEWTSDLPPEPQKPGEGASPEAVSKYKKDLKEYLDKYGVESGKQHERFMREAMQVRNLASDIVEANAGQFQVLDDVQEMLGELGDLDLSKLNEEQQHELGGKLDELRARSGQMFDYAFKAVNDNQGYQLSDKELQAVTGAVMSAWCDVDAILNDLEAKSGRVQNGIPVVLRDNPVPPGGNQALRNSHAKVHTALENTLSAMKEGDPKTLASRSDDLQRELVSAFNMAKPLFRQNGPDEAQARQLLALVTQAARIGVELDRSPPLRGRQDIGIDGWKDMVKTLLPSHLDMPNAKNEPPSYAGLRLAPDRPTTTNAPPQAQAPSGSQAPRGYNPFDDDVDEPTGNKPVNDPPPRTNRTPVNDPPPRTNYNPFDNLPPRTGYNPFDDDDQ